MQPKNRPGGNMTISHQKVVKAWHTHFIQSFFSYLRSIFTLNGDISWFNLLCCNFSVVKLFNFGNHKQLLITKKRQRLPMPPPPPRSPKSKRNCVKMNKNAYLARSENGNAGILQSNGTEKTLKTLFLKQKTEFSLVSGCCYSIFTLLYIGILYLALDSLGLQVRKEFIL